MTEHGEHGEHSGGGGGTGRVDASGARLMRLATGASVSVACILIVAKLAAALMTGSVSLLSSLVDSLLDAFASAVNFIAVRHALQPADREHRFGHGKAEPLAGLAQAAFIAGSGVFIVVEALYRLSDGHRVGNGEIGIAVMVLSILLTLALVAFQSVVVKRTGSVAISADALHYRMDLLLNAGVIAALVATTQLGLWWVDAVVAIAIAVSIAVSACKVAMRSLDLLMDREFPDGERERIKSIVWSHPETRGMHDLRTRSSGVQPFIQLHLELEPDLSLVRAHAIADDVERLIVKAFPGAEVIIHQDPAGHEAPHSPVQNLQSPDPRSPEPPDREWPGRG
ncbi:MAG: cation diffusion facilitator family transporter [Rhodospirillales bacterium]|nr:cation diffusion facilitator family transporter [Rhodospirillales bacterium]